MTARADPLDRIMEAAARRNRDEVHALVGVIVSAERHRARNEALAEAAKVVRHAPGVFNTFGGYEPGHGERDSVRWSLEAAAAAVEERCAQDPTP